MQVCSAAAGLCSLRGPHENLNPSFALLLWDRPQEVAEENPLVELQEHGFFPQDTRPPIPDASLQKLPPSTHRKPPLLTQVQLLFKRERLTIQRYPMTFLFTLAVIIFMCILCGILFFGVGARPPSDAGVLSGVLGAIVQVMILNMMMNAGIVNASVVFEKHLFLREYATDHYFVVPFMAAKFTVESLQSLVITLFAVRTPPSSLCFSFKSTGKQLARLSPPPSLLLWISADGYLVFHGQAQTQLWCLLCDQLSLGHQRERHCHRSGGDDPESQAGIGLANPGRSTATVLFGSHRVDHAHARLDQLGAVLVRTPLHVRLGTPVRV